MKRIMRVTKYGIRNGEDRRPKMVKEVAFNYNSDRFFSEPQIIVDLLNSSAFQLSTLTEEYVYMLALDTKCRLIGVFEISHGDVNSSCISTRSIYERALLCGATGIVIAHNHPSGIPEPSAADKAVCNKIKTAGELLDVKLLDFLIIGNPGFFSFNAENLLL